MLSAGAGETREAYLPWGEYIRVKAGDVIGNSILKLGVYELAVSEVLWRLLDEGESFIDVGGNIGYMTSLMSAKTGSQGRGMAFEPHPEIFARLQTNVGNRKGVEVFQCALGRSGGKLMLLEPDAFSGNEGTARLAREANKLTDGIEVSVLKLDDLIADDASIGVMKVDVEGAELEVFQGADRLLRSHQIRDIVFEDFGDFPSACVVFLRERGYSIYRISKGFTRVRYWDPSSPSAKDDGLPWEPVNYAATVDVTRLAERLRPRGWQVLMGKRSI